MKHILATAKHSIFDRDGFINELFKGFLIGAFIIVSFGFLSGYLC